VTEIGNPGQSSPRVLAVLGMSPGPIYNCLRGLVQAGMTPSSFTFIVTERDSGPSFDTIIGVLSRCSPETKFEMIKIPSLDQPFKEQVNAIKSLELDPTHFLTTTGTTQLICSIQSNLTSDVRFLHLRSEGHRPSRVQLICNGQQLAELTSASTAEVLELHCLVKVDDKQEVTLASGNKSLTMEAETYRIIGTEELLHSSSLLIDARGVLNVRFEWKRENNWWDVVLSESGKWLRHLGERAVIFSAFNVKNKSQFKRLEDLGWRVSQ